MQIEPLNDRRRDDRMAADVVRKLDLILNRLLAAHAVSAALERIIQRQIFQKTQNRRALVDADARQLADANARVGQGRHLRACEKVEAVLVVVLVDENLRRLFRRDRLLNVIGEHLAKREVRSDVHVSGGGETVFEVVHALDVETRTALVRMRGVFMWSKDAILDGVETGVEKRARVRARAQVAADAEAARSVDVAAKGEIGRAAEGLVVRCRETKTFRARSPKRWRQESRRTIARFDRDGRVREIENRNVFDL